MVGNKYGVETGSQGQEGQQELGGRRRLDWRSGCVCIGSILRSLGLRAGLTKRFEEGRRVNEWKVCREVQLEYIELGRM
jgi:hypothetical protein